MIKLINEALNEDRLCHKMKKNGNKSNFNQPIKVATANTHYVMKNNLQGKVFDGLYSIRCADG